MKTQKNRLVIAIIPARYGSTRFPGKPLAKIQEKTLIQRTYENAKCCRLLDRIIVATDDQRIYDHVLSFGGEVVMTPEECPTGSDRLAYVVQQDDSLKKAEFIVNIQGDEPCLDPKAIEQLVVSLRCSPEAKVSTAVVKIENNEEAIDPSDVKCVLDLQHYVLYFSRALIPGGLTLNFRKDVAYYKHLGIYAYTPEFLLEYTKLPITPLQRAEDLEQLKVLEHGYKIKAAIVKSASIGVNRPEDIKKVEQELCKKQNSFS